MNLSNIQHELASQSEAMGWEAHHTPSNLAAAISSEAGELLHLYRFVPPDPEPDPQSVAEELADILIFALRFAAVAHVDVEAAVWDKIAVNRQRQTR